MTAHMWERKATERLFHCIHEKKALCGIPWPPFGPISQLPHFDQPDTEKCQTCEARLGETATHS